MAIHATAAKASSAVRGAPASGAKSASARAAPTAMSARKPYQVIRSASSARPEWPSETRETMPIVIAAM